LKLHVAPNNGDRHFSKLFNVEETKGIIHSRIYPARDVVQPIWYNISALIRCNFIIKNYVNRKITSYIYLLIFTISLWLHVKHFITLKHEKGKSEKIFFCNYRSPLFGATGNFNHQILPYGILFLTFINSTNVFYLLSFKFSR
jgi:hypothetical protein